MNNLKETIQDMKQYAQSELKRDLDAKETKRLGCIAFHTGYLQAIVEIEQLLDNKKWV